MGSPKKWDRTQAVDALGEANRVRVEIARVKRDLKAGSRTPAQVIDLAPTQRIEVVDFIMALPGWGLARAMRALRSMDPPVFPQTKMAGLSPIRKDELLMILERGPAQWGLGWNQDL